MADCRKSFTLLTLDDCCFQGSRQQHPSDDHIDENLNLSCKIWICKMKSWSVDEWRRYFGSANSDIFEIIEHAINVAASDSPKEFRVRRDGIAEKLFSCSLTRCVGCDRVELAVAVAVAVADKEQGDGDDERGYKSGFERDGVARASKESKVNWDVDRDVNGVSNYSLGEAEALSDEMEEQSRYVAEILRIRDVLRNREDESESVLFDSLRRLQLMELSVDCLKATEIGKAVNPLRKHTSMDISQLAKTLIRGWKELVDEWVKATTTTVIAGSEGGTPDSIDPSVVDDEEEGLPSPPMDEGAFFVTQTGSMELSQFFDGMDDNGNPRPSGPLNKNRENARKPTSESHVIENRKLQVSHETAITNRDVKSQQPKKNEAVVPVRPNKPVNAGPNRPPYSNMQKKNNVEPRMQQNVNNNSITRRPPTGHLDKPVLSDDAAVQMKLEATKRKLQERYQQAENAKRQRTIQVMEINELPKQVVHRNPHFKPGYHNWNARR